MHLKPAPTQTDWVKVCTKNNEGREHCFTSRDFVSEQGRSVMSVAVYEIEAGNRQVLRVLVPLGLRLVPGVRFSIDKGTEMQGQFGMCYQSGCFADAMIGSTLRVSAEHGNGRSVEMNAPLAGFAKAVEGPPIDPAVLLEMQKKSEGVVQSLPEGLPAPGAAPLTPKQ